MIKRDRKTFLAARIKAFEFAFIGIWSSFKRETHLKIHFIATILVTAAGILFKITPVEWIIVISCCSIVLAAELFNSAIEKMCDLVTTERDPKIKYIKDVSAGAVLVLSIGTAFIGYFVFGKYFV
jgi:diacylglycerol kinase (ATP)